MNRNRNREGWSWSGGNGRRLLPGQDGFDFTPPRLPPAFLPGWNRSEETTSGARILRDLVGRGHDIAGTQEIVSRYAVFRYVAQADAGRLDPRELEEERRIAVEYAESAGRRRSPARTTLESLIRHAGRRGRRLPRALQRAADTARKASHRHGAATLYAAAYRLAVAQREFDLATDMATALAALLESAQERAAARHWRRLVKLLAVHR